MNKHFVILPNGTKATRNSQSREYTHCVMVEYDHDVLRAAAEKAYRAKGWMRTYASNWRYLHETAAGTDHFPSPERMADAKAQLEATPDFESYAEHCVVDQLAKLEEAIAKGYYDPGVVTWCGRHDLAVKQLSKYDGREGATATILPVNRI